MTDAAMAGELAQRATRRALGTMLVERGLLEGAKLDEALRIGDETGERLGEVVVRLGWVSEENLAKVLAEQWQLRYLDRSRISFDANALSRISREEAVRLEALPMRFEGDGAMLVALAEPTEARLLALRSLLGDRIAPVVVAKSALDVGLRGDLLARRGGLAPVPEPEAEEDASEPSIPDTPEEDEGELAPAAESDAVADVGDFDEAAETMIEDLRARIGSLREVVVEARSAQERDRAEVERLRDELAERTEALRQLQEKLRGLADDLDV